MPNPEIDFTLNGLGGLQRLPWSVLQHNVLVVYYCLMSIMIVGKKMDRRPVEKAEPIVDDEI